MPAPRSRFHTTAPLLLLLAAGFAAACGEQAQPDSTGLSLRFVASDPQDPPEEAFAVDWLPGHEWSFDHGAVAPWKVVAGGEAPGKGLAIAYDSTLAAEDVDLIRVDLTSPRREVTAEFRWRISGDESAQVFTARTACPSSYRLHRCESALRDRPGWKGEISWLEIQLDVPEADVVLQEVRLLRQPTLSDRQAQALLNGTKIDLDGDVRNVLVGLPGAAIERTLRIPPRSRLRFAYGRTKASLSGPVLFRVSVASGPLLFEATLVNTDPPGWREAEVDLADFGGREIVLRLEVEARSPADVAYWGHPEVTAPPPANPPPNILLISIDTLRADRLSLYGYPRPTSPHLDRWARSRAAIFQTAVAQAPWTLPSHVSIFTGLNPNRYQSNMPNAADPGLTMLPEILRDAGYATMAVTGGAFLHPQYGFSQGFDRYYYELIPTHEDESGQEIENGVATALRWLDQNSDRPFFLFFHTYEVHDPYLPRQPHFGQFTDQPPITVKVPPRSEARDEGFQVRRAFSALAAQEELNGLSPTDVTELVSAAYDSGIAYADEQVNRILEKLEELALDDDTIVVVTSDHGEMLGEHDAVGHLYLYEGNILVPLMIAAPEGRGAGRVVPDQVRSIDILPTILDLAGLAPVTGIDGRTLVPLIDGERSSLPPEAFTYAARWNAGISLRYDNRFKYVYNDTVWAPAAGSERFARLDQAGSEAEAVAADAPAETPELKRRLREDFFDSLPGVRIRLRNSSDSKFSGVLTGWGNRYGVKSMDMECSCLEFHHSEMRFQVPPGEAFTLVLLALKSQVRLGLRLETTAGDGEPLTYTSPVTMEQIDDRHVIHLTPLGWQVAASGVGELESSVSFWWQGDESLAESSEVEIDEALRARLRALGYLGEASEP